MPNGTDGSLRGRKIKYAENLFCFPPARLDTNCMDIRLSLNQIILNQCDIWN